jgi:hypothetical protein
MQWTPLLNEHMEYSYAVADKLMSMVEESELDWKPATGKNWMTVGQLLLHLTNACGFCCKGFATGDWGMPEGATMEDMPAEEMLPPAEALSAVASVAEARKLLADDKALGLQMVAEAGEERLENEMSSAPWAPGMDKSLGAHMLGMCQHLDSHRHQLFYYLKLMDKDVNTEHLWGM